MLFRSSSGELHVVAEVVEAKLIVLAVGNVGEVRAALLLLAHAVVHAANVEAEEPMNPAHRLSVTLSEIVVDGDDVHALAGQGVQVLRQRCDQSLSFTGSHLGDHVLVQDGAADELHVEVPHSQNAT